MRKSRFMDQQMVAILREPARAPTSVGGTNPLSSRFRDDRGCGRTFENHDVRTPLTLSTLELGQRKGWAS